MDWSASFRRVRASRPRIPPLPEFIAGMRPVAVAHRAFHLSARAGLAVCGFTLLELMIVVVIVGILAAIALPSYSSFLRKSARAEAQSFLTDAASRQQQFLVDRRAYAASIASLNVTPPSDLAAKFTFAVATTNGPPPTFALTAQAIGDQLKDQCPTLTLDNAGNRTAPGAVVPGSCW